LPYTGLKTMKGVGITQLRHILMLSYPYDSPLLAQSLVCRFHFIGMFQGFVL
jgi:hypothetical protein